jgi:hypothetical protein
MNGRTVLPAFVALRARAKLSSRSHAARETFAAVARPNAPSCLQKGSPLRSCLRSLTAIGPSLSRKPSAGLFERERRLLGLLSRTAYEAVGRSFEALFDRKDVRPGCVLSIQTFGSYGANFNPHCHAIISDGVWTREGDFLELPSIDTAAVCELFRRLFLRRLHRQERLTERFMHRGRASSRRFSRVDPLLCVCGPQMKIVSLITDPRVVDRILRHLEREACKARNPFELRGPPAAASASPA